MLQVQHNRLLPICLTMGYKRDSIYSRLKFIKRDDQQLMTLSGFTQVPRTCLKLTCFPSLKFAQGIEIGRHDRKLRVAVYST